MDTCTNLHFTQSNASFGRLDVANLKKNNPGRPSVSPLMFNPLKNGAKLQWLSQVMLLCFQILSGCKNSRKSQERQYEANILSPPYFSLVTYYPNISPPQKSAMYFPKLILSKLSLVPMWLVYFFLFLSPLSFSQLCFLYSQHSEGNCCPSPCWGQKGDRCLFLVWADLNFIEGELPQFLWWGVNLLIWWPHQGMFLVGTLTLTLPSHGYTPKISDHIGLLKLPNDV